MAHEELFARIKALQLYPPFLAKLKELVAACRARGATYFVTSGERTFEEQNKLYAKGRTELSSGIVTYARGGGSLHNYAIAADLCFDKSEKPGLQPDWADKYYVILAEEAEKVGLESGYNWKKFKDSGHVQLPIGSKGIALQQLLDAYEKGGKVAVFSFLDQYSW